MQPDRSLHIQLYGYWHAGGGRSSGNYLDAMCERDDDLPVLPGRQLKGLLRQAVCRAQAWGWLDDIACPEGPCANAPELLFGSATQEVRRYQTLPGMLQVTSATLPRAERDYLTTPAGYEMRASLFGELFSTAIDDNGSAQAHSLRGIETAIPMPLEARLRLRLTALDPAHRAQQDAWVESIAPWQVLERVLPLIDHIGAHRTRGLGECQLSLAAVGA